MTYQGVVFDLDGTLLDTLEDLADSMNAALASLSLATHPVDAYRYFVGDGVVNLARRALPEDQRDDGVLERAVQLMRDEYQKRWDAKTRPYAGVGEMLAGLSARGVKMGVLTNKPQEFAELCVQRLLPRERFDIVQGVTDEVPPKPNATGLRRVIECFDLPLDACLYVGDTNTDMVTAGGAGLFSVGVTWGFRPREELEGSGARAIIDRPIELLDLLSGPAS
jgi:phosphoglycolate phosphatase